MKAGPSTPPSSVRLRRATLADRGLITPLVLGLYQEHPGPLPVSPAKVEATIAWFSSHPEAGDAWLVESEDGQAVVGYAFVARYWSNEFGGLTAILDELAFAPAWRGRGLGTRVIAEIEAAQRALGVKALLLEVDRDNPRAKRLYESLGFVATGRDHLRKLL